MKRAYTLQSGLISILIYVALILFLIWAFVKNVDTGASKESSQNAIRVDMSKIDVPQSKSSKPKEEISSKSSQNRPKEETKEQKSTKEEPQKLQTDEKKTVNSLEEKKVVTKKQDTNTTVKKSSSKPALTKTKPSSLFDDISVNAPPQSSKSTSVKSQNPPSSMPASSKSSKASDLIKSQSSTSSQGVESAYKSKVKSILYGWPTQSDYAGNKAKIRFVIQTNGSFTFEIINSSTNEEFNKGLIQYLKQLQKVGFGPHLGDSPYIFDVDFIAER